MPGQVLLLTAAPRDRTTEGLQLPHPPIPTEHYTLTATDCNTQSKPYKAARFSFLKHVNPLSSFPAWIRRARFLTHAKGRAKAAETAALTPAGKRQAMRAGEKGAAAAPGPAPPPPRGAGCQGCRGRTMTVTRTVTATTPVPPCPYLLRAAAAAIFARRRRVLCRVPRAGAGTARGAGPGAGPRP